jgi:hypothetical protein
MLHLPAWRSMSVIKRYGTSSEPAVSNRQPSAYHKLERLNSESPTFYSTELQSFVVTRMGQILEVFKQADVFSSANVQDPVFPLCDRATKAQSVQRVLQPGPDTSVPRWRNTDPVTAKSRHATFDQMATALPRPLRVAHRSLNRNSHSTGYDRTEAG